MIRNALRAVLAEPRAPHLPERVTRDWLLVGALVLIAVLEGTFRPDLYWRVPVTLLAAGLAFTLLWRRTRPVAVIAVLTASVVATDVASVIADQEHTPGLYTMSFILLLPYALYRWASGKEIAYGTALLLVLFGSALAADWTSLGEAIAAFVFFAFPGVLGASVRFFTTSRLREIERVRVQERAELARELHDTVAHHVSAMVVRAQAGRVVAGADPAAAVQALELIETEGAKTLAEMRFMVGALRDPGVVELSPQAGLADVERLARASGGAGRDGAGAPVVSVTVDGAVEGVPPAVGAAVYRIAQESVTNALRHARGASSVLVSVSVDPSHVLVSVRDDGAPTTSPLTGSGWSAAAGFGIAGMTERAQLLGGTLRAGPAEDGVGWVVEAALPRVGSAHGS